jgi:hypothetical protein
MDYSEERKYIIDFLIGNPSRAARVYVGERIEEEEVEIRLT